MRLIKEYIDQGDQAGGTGPRGPAGHRGPAGPPGPALPPRGAPTALELLPPATGFANMRSNPDGSTSLDGHLTITGPVGAGVPLPVLILPGGHGPDDSMRIPAVAWHEQTSTYTPVNIDLNPNSPTGSDVFLMASTLPDGDTLHVSVDHIVFWPAAAT